MKEEKKKISVLIIAKFEIGEISGDFPGEAQLFYEKYCPDCTQIEIPHMPPTAGFYFNEDNGVAILITGSGKIAASLSLMNLLSNEQYDFSDAYLVSVGCGGGNSDFTSFGDVVVVTAVCDYDLGHHVDAHEKADNDSQVMWFPDISFDDYQCKFLNAELADKVYQLIKDLPLQTTENAIKEMSNNFPDREDAQMLPIVRKGTVVSGDNFWKGVFGHVTAAYIADHYDCPDPYTVTEMEEMAIANTVSCFDLTDKIISLRAIVNMDIFLNDQTPESTWDFYADYNDKVKDKNDETSDAFEPTIHNLFDAAEIVIDAILEGNLQ